MHRLRLLTLVAFSPALVSLGFSNEPDAGIKPDAAHETVNGGGRETALLIPDRREPREGATESFELLRTALEDAEQALREIPAYTATLEQQVDIDGKLREPERIDVKVRHEPFSVYMKWRSDGQEALFVDGENDNRILARPTRGLVALRKVWRIDPDSRQAMKNCRHPITELGIKRLQERVTEFHQSRDFSTDGLECRHFQDRIEGRPCLKFETVFHSPREGEFSRSVVAVDAVSKLVIGVENYGWRPDGRPGELLERYVYHEIRIVNGFPNREFDESNPDYNFVQR